MEEQIKEAQEEYQKAYELVCYFAEIGQERMCDGYLTMAKDCIDLMLREIISTLHFGRNKEILGYWEAVRSWVPDALKQYEID